MIMPTLCVLVQVNSGGNGSAARGRGGDSGGGEGLVSDLDRHHDLRRDVKRLEDLLSERGVKNRQSSRKRGSRVGTMGSVCGV